MTAITAAMSPPGTGNVFLDAAGAAIANAKVQGIAIALGLQKKFDWTGVAAAGVSAGIGSAVGSALHMQPYSENNTVANYVAYGVSSMASAMANAATRSLVNGSDFGDNIIAGLPDVLGHTFGNMMAYGIAGPASAADAAVALAHEGCIDQ